MDERFFLFIITGLSRPTKSLHMTYYGRTIRTKPCPSKQSLVPRADKDFDSVPLISSTITSYKIWAVKYLKTDSTITSYTFQLRGHSEVVLGVFRSPIWRTRTQCPGFEPNLGGESVMEMVLDRTRVSGGLHARIRIL